MTAQAGGASLPFSDPIAMSLTGREQIRRQMRARRRQLSPRGRARAASEFARLARRSGLLRPGRRIGVYLAHGAEADLSELIDAARRSGCLLYLPVITDYHAGRMRFARFAADTVLKPNRYGILEPVPPRPTFVQRLDLVFTPLVAVDERGWRIGSGAGFYDRAMQHLRRSREWRRPRLIGVCYEFQRVPVVDFAPWDVPLDAVLTEENLYRTSREAR